MKTSEKINEIVAALSKAQGQMSAAKKDSENPGLKNESGKVAKYADLASVWEAIREPLTSNGLAVLQPVGAVQIKSRDLREVKKYDKYAKKEYNVTELIVEASVSITTILTHTSGQFFEETLEMPVLALTPHAIGSAITYGRRYSLAAITGCVQDDDDGNSAGKLDDHKGDEPKPSGKPTKEDKPKGNPPKEDKPKGATPPPEDKPKTNPDGEKTRQLYADIMQLKKNLEMTDDDLKFAIKEVLGVDRLNGQTADKYNELAEFLGNMVIQDKTFREWRNEIEETAKMTDKIELPDFPE